MAAFPCMHCQRRFAGEAMNAYLSVFDRDQQEKYRLVVCPDCLETVLEVWRQLALFRNGDGEWEYHDPTDPPVPRTTPRDQREAPRSRRDDSGVPLPWDDTPRARQRRKSSD